MKKITIILEDDFLLKKKTFFKKIFQKYFYCMNTFLNSVSKMFLK